MSPLPLPSSRMEESGMPGAQADEWKPLNLAALVRIELSKMRRLHTPVILLALVIVIVLFEGGTLYSASSQAIASDPSKFPWAQELISVAMINALLHPILVAVISSRQVDMENTGDGWMLNATAGTRPGRLMRVKLIVLALILLFACTFQLGAILVLGLHSGITVPFDALPWIGYFLMLWAVDLVLTAGHVLLSARFENQLISMGTGLLGAFAGIYLFLAPMKLARWLPWGYFTVINPTCLVGEAGDVRVEYCEPGTAWLIGLFVLVAVIFAVLTRRADTIKG